MATATDLTAKAQAAAEQFAARIADRLPDLPKPVLAAIGAADLAGRQLVELLEKFGERTGIADLPRSPGAIGDRVGDTVGGSVSGALGDVRGAAEDLPAKVSEMVQELPARAKEFADQLEGMATRIPGRAQRFTDELPGRFSEVGEQLQPEHLRQTAEAYGQLAGSIFASLVDRGEKAWSEVRSGGPESGTVIEGEKLDPEKVSRERAAAAKAPFPKSERPTPNAATTPEPAAARKPAATKPAAARKSAAKPAAPKKPAVARKPAAGKTSLAEPVDPATLPEHVVPPAAGTPRPPRRRPTPPAGS